MSIIIYRSIWLIILLVNNQLKAEINLSPQASWNQTGETVAGWSNATVGSSPIQLDTPWGISITSNDVLYIGDAYNHRIIVVDLNSTNNISIIGPGSGIGPNQFNILNDLFVTNMSLYVIDFGNQRVQKTSLNRSNPSMMTILSGLNSPCYLYVDNNDNIYLSDTQNHGVLFFHSNSTNSMVVAGTGTAGTGYNQLNQPYGIFVNQNGTIYIADCYNYRIMKWFSGSTSGFMVAGDGTAGSSPTQLYYPTQIIVESNEYMYISEGGNARITRWAANANFGVCIAACTGTAGTALTQLNNPHSLAFDSQGSLYVSDTSNHRIQKFQIFQYRSPSYNQPKLSSCATWNPNAITFADSSIVGSAPVTVFVSSNNTVYVAATNLNLVLGWTEESSAPTQNISNGLNNPYGIFATVNGDIYMDNGWHNHRLDKWSWNSTSSVAVMNVNSRCFSLFIDINDTLYCSMDAEHKVIKRSLNNGSNTPIIAAGNGTEGSGPNMLSFPNGIFVDSKFSLYVADCGNNRIQLFQPGEVDGTTVVSNDTSLSVTLRCPTAVILDADGYLFITDSSNDRIIRSRAFDFQCLFGCTGVAGSTSNQLYYPHALSFDSHGNLFVVDSGNNRIQKFFLTTNSCVPSYNQPKFSSCATWNTNATTIANESFIGIRPGYVFVDLNNTIYVPARSLSRVQVWSERNTTPTKTISNGLNTSISIFVTLNGDIYVDNGMYNGRVDKWALNATSSVTEMYVNGSCYKLFIDINDNIYCSLRYSHQVIKKLLNANVNTSIVAGTGTAGSSSDMLNGPRGIFVDINFNLYVADCGNNRIQLFRSGQLNGTSVAINGSNGAFTLSCPTDVVLDIDGYLFITDSYNNRILGSGSLGFRCIVGCTNTTGSASNQLNRPNGIAFDNYGNLFVMDTNNSRLQKFVLSSDSCGSQSSSFSPPICLPSTHIGSSCNISTLSCDILKPCLNNATCINKNNNTLLAGYICVCPPGYNGTECQYDHRPCQSYTCWNNGTCNETSSTTFVCQCPSGWQGNRCETKINYCQNITCLNNGVCRPLLLNYTCRCLSGYSGEHCEITSNKLTVRKTVSRSFAYVVIIAMISVAIFIVTLDLLTYCFGIDRAKSKKKKSQSRRQRKPKKKTKPISIIRYIYVNAPPKDLSENPPSLLEETTV